MKQRFLLFTATLCSTLAAVFMLTGCREDTIIKSTLTPAVDNIHTFGIGPDFNNGTDTITLFTKTLYDDTVVTSTRDAYPIYHALGWVTDPFAGTTSGSIFMQVVPTTVGFKYPTGTTVDSLVLVLPYSGFTWGDTTVTTTRTVKAFRITEGFSKDSTFYNYSSRATDPAVIGTATLQTGRQGTGSIGDSVSAGGVNRTPHLRIKLSDAYKSTFMAAVDSDASFTSFVAQLPGICIAPDTSGSGVALPYFRLNNGIADLYASAAVVAYAHTDGKTDTLVYQFPYSVTDAAHFNRITRNYRGTPAATLLDTTIIHDLAVMQNGPGAFIDVKLPFIQSLAKNLLNKNIIINKAELVFTKYPSISDDKFFGPARLYPQGVNSSGGRYTIADYYTGNSLDFIDGTPHASVKSGTSVTEYRINIPREVQKAIVQGSDGLHLRIGGTINFPAAYRLVVGGSGMPKGSVYRPSLNIIYSKQ